MNRKWNELSKEEQETAKALYMEYQSVVSIAKELNVSRTTLQYHAKTYWEAEREMNRAELFSQFTASKKSKFIEMSEASIKIITKALTTLASRDVPPTAREAKDAVAILESLDKITRLDDGKPTDITEEKIVEVSEIKKITSLVPFNLEEEEDEDVKKPN
jgi:hypothetical protein